MTNRPWIQLNAKAPYRTGGIIAGFPQLESSEVKKFTIATGRSKNSAYPSRQQRGGVVQLRCDSLLIQTAEGDEEDFILEAATLFSACLIALIAVFNLLGVLALTIELITTLFPDRRQAVDPVLAAAISTTVAQLIPGARVTRIEEDS